MSIEVMKQALEALEELNRVSIGVDAVCLPGEIDTAMDALRLAIEQAEKQEPVGWITQAGLEVDRTTLFSGKSIAWRIPVYTAPPQQEKQEPVAWGYRSKRGQIIDCVAPEDHGPTTKEFNVPLYAAPLNLADKSVQKRLATQWGFAPQRQPLTESEAAALIEDVDWYNYPADLIRAAERAHGIGGEHD